MNCKSLCLIGIILIVLLNACSGPQNEARETNTNVPTKVTSAATNTPPPATATAGPILQSSQAGSFLAIHEVGLGPEGYVSLTNFTSVPVSTNGLYICQGVNCFEMPEAVIKAGETGRVAVGNGEGLEGVIASQAKIGELKPADGEVALFASNKFDDPKALLVYLQWGSTPHMLTKLAVEAGLWIETGYAPTSLNAIRLYRVEDSGLWLFEEP